MDILSYYGLRYMFNIEDDTDNGQSDVWWAVAVCTAGGAAWEYVGRLGFVFYTIGWTVLDAVMSFPMVLIRMAG